MPMINLTLRSSLVLIKLVKTYSTTEWAHPTYVSLVIELDTQAIDSVLAFPQAELEVPVYMELPAGMDIAGHGKDSSK